MTRRNEQEMGDARTQDEGRQRRPESSIPCSEGRRREEDDEGDLVAKIRVERQPDQRRDDDARDGHTVSAGCTSACGHVMPLFREAVSPYRGRGPRSDIAIRQPPLIYQM